MFFLLRAAFWLSLVIIFLPADKPDGSDAPSVSAFQAISAAHDAFSDVSQFCQRNPDTCVTGSAALQVFGDKLRTGVKLISSAFANHKTDGAQTAGTGTLTPDDLKPAWHDPSKRNAAT
jgi:hypothetical protein